MAQDFINKKNSGSASSHEPKLIGVIIQDTLQSDSPFAVAYRQHNATVYPNTEPCIDLKLLTRRPGRIPIGDRRGGVITRDDEGHFTFVENATEKKRTAPVMQRSQHIYKGRCINVNRQQDGTLFPSFNRPQLTPDFTFCDFCTAAARELRMVAEYL